jgi:hypothetical protein
MNEVTDARNSGVDCGVWRGEKVKDRLVASWICYPTCDDYIQMNIFTDIGRG